MKKVQSIAIPLTMADESTAIASITQEIPAGFLVGVASTAGAMDASDTYTVKITDVNGVTIYEVGSLAESTTTVDFETTSTETFPMHIPCVGPLTVTVTASAEQNDAAVEFTVYLYIEL